MLMRSLFGKWFARRPAAARQATAPARLGLEPLESRWVPSTLTVGRGEEYASISAALAHARSGATILLSPGTYTENVTIPGNLSDLTLKASGYVSIDNPSTNSTAPVIEIETGSTNDIVEGFVINGETDGNSTGGVLIQSGASATIGFNTIENFYNGSNSQVGDGIVVNGTGRIQDNLVEGYQKDGILVDGSGASASVENNTVIGAARVRWDGTVTTATPNVAQNGIQLSNGAYDTDIVGNVVSDNYYDPTQVDNTFATGIIVFNVNSASSRDTGNFVGQNTVVNNELGCNVLDVGTNLSFTPRPSTVVLTMANNNFDENGIVGGVYIQQSAYVVANANNASNNLSDGFYTFQSSTITLNDDTAINNSNPTNSYQKNTQGNGNGIVLDTTTNSTVENAVCALNTANGIVLTNSTGNSIIFSIASANGGNGISLLNGSNGNTVKDNLSLLNVGSGIYEDGTSGSNTLAQNTSILNGH
jgi:parallel beta-helix repeat protein